MSSEANRPGSDDAASPSVPEAVGDPLGALGGLGGLLDRARELMEAAHAAADTVVEGTAGGGAVRVRVDGRLQFHAVQIDPGVVDPDEVELLEDLVLTALRDAAARLAAAAPDPAPGLDLGGLDLGGLDLGGLFGEPPGDDT